MYIFEKIEKKYLLDIHTSLYFCLYGVIDPYITQLFLMLIQQGNMMSVHVVAAELEGAEGKYLNCISALDVV